MEDQQDMDSQKLYPKDLYRQASRSKDRDDYYSDTATRIRCRCCGISWIDQKFFLLHLSRSNQCCFYYWRIKTIQYGAHELVSAGLHYDGSNPNKTQRGLLGVNKHGILILIPMTKRDAMVYMIGETNAQSRKHVKTDT